MDDNKHFIEEVFECSRAEPNKAKQAELQRHGVELNKLVEDFYKHRTTNTLKALVGAWTKAWFFMKGYQQGGPQPPLAGSPDVDVPEVEEKELRAA